MVDLFLLTERVNSYCDELQFYDMFNDSMYFRIKSYFSKNLRIYNNITEPISSGHKLFSWWIRLNLRDYQGRLAYFIASLYQAIKQSTPL